MTGASSRDEPDSKQRHVGLVCNMLRQGLQGRHTKRTKNMPTSQARILSQYVDCERSESTAATTRGDVSHVDSDLPTSIASPSDRFERLEDERFKALRDLLTGVGRNHWQQYPTS
jgi:hypothetical protein